MKVHPVHVCRECGTTAPRWTGRCSGCGEWNTLDEERATAKIRSTAVTTTSLRDIGERSASVHSTGVGELDRVLGGGFIPGSTTLLFGEPGVGKSTLALMSLRALA
ncbi:MAG TPA: ATPase domain-containing protein, partial [Acidimicrobiales bacterium]